MRTLSGVAVVLLVSAGCPKGGERPSTAVPAERADAGATTVDAPPAPAPVDLPGRDLAGDPLPLPDRVSARLGNGRLRHPGGATSIAWSADGAHLVTAGGDVIRLWDAATGELVRELTARPAALEVAAVSPDASLVVGGKDELIAWGPDGAERWRLDVQGETVEAVTFSPDGSRVAVAITDHAMPADYEAEYLRVVDAATGTPVFRLKKLEDFSGAAVAFSPDGARIAVSGSGTRVFDAATGKRLTTSKDGGADAAFTPDGGALVFAGVDGVGRLALAKRKVTWRRSRDGERVDRVALSPDGGTLFVAGEGAIRALDPTRFAERRVVADGLAPYVVALAVSPDGTRLAVAGDHQQPVVLDVADGRRAAFHAGHLGPVNRVAFAPTGARVASAGEDGAVLVWDLAGRPVAAVSGHRDGVTGLAFTADGAQLASVDRGGRVIVSRADDGAQVATVDVAERLHDAVFLPDGRLLIAGSDHLLAWTPGEAPVPVPLSEDGTATALALSPDGTLVFAGGYADGWLLDARTLAEVRTCDASYAAAARFSPDGTVVAVASASSLGVTIVDVASGAQVGRGIGSMQAGVAWTPDGRGLAIAGEGRSTIAAVDGATAALTPGETLDPWPLDPTHATATAVDVSPDGRRIVTGHLDGSALIWAR